jgi:DNA modification methylase
VDKNQLYYGDNLVVLREYIKDESVDLIYLDPPFNSRQDYNVLFAERDGTRSASQIMAFEDTWEWNMDAERAYEEIVERGGRVSDAMRAFRTFLGHSDMMAYLAMMAPRLIELHRVLKVTGSIYLHCDPTASHYLKIILDAIFGPEDFLNEVTWKRSSAHSDTKQGMKRFGRIRDLLLVYSKSEQRIWNPVYTPYTKEYLESEYRHVSPDGRRYKETDATAARPGGDTEYEWRVRRPKLPDLRWEPDFTEEYKNPVEGWEYLGVRPYNGRYWGYSKANLEKFWKDGHLIHRKTGMPRIVQFANEMPGVPLQDLWDDIPPASGAEDLGYPTQKPKALLGRIIKSSSNEGDVVLDPFCGCGTAIEAAQLLNRRWIGIDITHLAIGLIKKRLSDAFGDSIRDTYEVIGEPVDLAGAKKLAEDDPYQFQWWALSLVGARPLEKKKGADQGIDGRLYFHDERGGKTKQIIFSVKAGHVQAAHVRDLRGVIEREKAEIGVLLSMEPPTKPMLKEAAEAGLYQPPGLADKYPRIQILSTAQLLEGKQIQYPRLLDVTFKKAPKSRKDAEKQMPVRFEAEDTEGPF